METNTTNTYTLLTVYGQYIDSLHIGSLFLLFLTHKFNRLALIMDTRNAKVFIFFRYVIVFFFILEICIFFSLEYS